MLLEKIILLFTKDLKLPPDKAAEFQNQFIQIFIYNLILNFPEDKKPQLLNFLDKSAGTENIKQLSIEEVKKMGFDQVEAGALITNTLRKSISEVKEQYKDVLSSQTLQTLENYS